MKAYDKQMTQTGAKFQIGRMEVEDLPEILEIERSSFPTPWSERLFKSELKSPLSRNFVVKAIPAQGSKQVVGYINFWVFAGEVHLNNIAVDKESRNLGVGSLLIKKMISLAKKEEHAFWLTLEVRPSNSPAIALYEKFGFRVRGIRPRYYTDTLEDAYIMWSDLEKMEDNGCGWR